VVQAWAKSKTLFSKTKVRNKKVKGAGGMVEAVEHLPSKQFKLQYRQKINKINKNS
jgi:hypothetical protein